jgi:hypothetical protein
MCKININWTIFKYSIMTLIELVLSISGIFSVLTIYKLYESTLLFYFLLYNIIVSVFAILHFFKVLKDMLNEEISDIVYVKIKVLLMIASFIWGIVILEHKSIILFYQNNYPRVYVSFINYFIMSSLSILDIGYKILCHFCEKKPNNRHDYSILAKIEEELDDSFNNHLEKECRVEMIPKPK